MRGMKRVAVQSSGVGAVDPRSGMSIFSCPGDMASAITQPTLSFTPLCNLTQLFSGTLLRICHASHHLLQHNDLCTDDKQVFKRMIDQYDRLRKRNAFLEQYKKEDMFANGLEEFDDSRRVVADLIE